MPVAATIEKKDILRDKRAQGIAAMGLVTRHGDRFQVQTPSLRGRRTAYEVWRDEANKVRCTCLEFEEHATHDATFRCEHILAVKHSLVAKNSEAVTKQVAKNGETAIAADANGAKQVAPHTGKTIDVLPATNNERASEKRADTRFERERSENLTEEVEATKQVESHQAEMNQTVIAAEKTSPVVRSLAQHTQSKEQEMRHQNNAPVAVSDDEIIEDETEQMNESQSSPQTSQGGQVVPLASFSNTLRTLRQPVEAKLVKTREGWIDRNGNTHLVEYIEWHTVADTLDRVCPTWSHEVKSIAQIGDMVAVTAAITIDNVTREGIGTGSADNETGIKKAEHDALKRAAIKFGLARDLYQRESEVIERNGSTPESGNEFPRDPLAKSMADLVTPKQLGMIRALAREASLDVEDECQSVLRCRTEELSKKAASAFIDHLKNANAATAANNTMRRAS